LNSEPAAPGELPALFRSRLESRVVYFDGDSIITFKEAMPAIEIIRAEHGQGSLLTAPSAGGRGEARHMTR
jgi:hypothetical protein